MSILNLEVRVRRFFIKMKTVVGFIVEKKNKSFVVFMKDGSQISYPVGYSSLCLKLGKEPTRSR